MASNQFRLFMFLVRLLFFILFAHADFRDIRVRDKFAVINAMSVDPLYLQHKHTQKAIDLRVNIFSKAN
jgi:hypothetical protein